MNSRAQTGRARFDRRSETIMLAARRWTATEGLFTAPAPQTVILIEAGDVVLPLRFSDLRTREELKVEAAYQMAVEMEQAAHEIQVKLQ